MKEKTTESQSLSAGLLHILGGKLENVAEALVRPMGRKWFPQEKAGSMIVSQATLAVCFQMEHV